VEINKALLFLYFAHFDSMQNNIYFNQEHVRYTRKKLWLGKYFKISSIGMAFEDSADICHIVLKME
jgi:hypothetical protein